MPGDRTAVAVINDLHPEGIIGYLRLEVEVGAGVNDPVGDQFAGQQESGKRQDAVDVLTREELTDKLPGRRNARGLGGRVIAAATARPSFRGAIVASTPAPELSNHEDDPGPRVSAR